MRNKCTGWLFRVSTHSLKPVPALQVFGDLVFTLFTLTPRLHIPNTHLPHIMSNDRGVVLASVKNRMQALRDELDNVKDSYDAKCKECEALVEEKNQVIYSILLATCNNKVVLIS